MTFLVESSSNLKMQGMSLLQLVHSAAGGDAFEGLLLNEVGTYFKALEQGFDRLTNRDKVGLVASYYY
jgi:hypothetical protein